MVLDLTEATDRVRLAVADTSDVPIFPNDVYDYLLTKYSNNEVAATKEAAYLILGQLSQDGHERLDRLEFFGADKFNQYLKFIQEVIKNPNGYMNLAGIYVAGMDVTEVAENKADTTLVQHPLPDYNSCDTEVLTSFFEV